MCNLTQFRLSRAYHRYARSAFRAESAVRVAELAGQLGISPKTLRILTLRYKGCLPSAYLRLIRRRHALSLLRRSELSTTQVAYRAGYGTRRSIYRAFRRETGSTPRETASQPGG